MIKHILVPLDGSILAEAALPAVVALNRMTGAKITLIHVIEKKPPEYIHGQSHLNSEESAINYLKGIVSRYFADIKDIVIHVHEEPVDKVAESITNHIMEFSSDLLVMCSHGKGGIRDFFYGNIAQQIIGNKKGPVLIIRPEALSSVSTIKFEKILVPVDGNPEHEQGLSYAIQFAKEIKTVLDLLLIVSTFSALHGEQAAVGTLLPMSVSYILDELETAAEGYLSAQIEQLCHQGMEVYGEIRRGDPVEEIVQYTENNSYDLVVVGTHGKSGADAFWYGSKAAKIITRIKTPVLVVPVEKVN